MYIVCPKCGIPSAKVSLEVVKNFTKVEIPEESDYSVCVNPNCDLAYFSKDKSFRIDKLNELLFFKDKSDNAPICYCSNLTRGEIKNAVKNGSKTIDDVQEHTGKNITGKCKTENPLGQCCRNSFLYEIEQALGQQPTGFSFKPCNCCG
ncbi:MAG: (2Fe-2S)-binding protein [Flavobacteriales bacterium]|nr:(2Fe-2S)-binding protein [Bacteroidia bacterium]